MFLGNIPATEQHYSQIHDAATINNKAKPLLIQIQIQVLIRIHTLPATWNAAKQTTPNP